MAENRKWLVLPYDDNVIMYIMEIRYQSQEREVFKGFCGVFMGFSGAVLYVGLGMLLCGSAVVNFVFAGRGSERIFCSGVP